MTHSLFTYRIILILFSFHRLENSSSYSNDIFHIELPNYNIDNLPPSSLVEEILKTKIYLLPCNDCYRNDNQKHWYLMVFFPVASNETQSDCIVLDSGIEDPFDLDRNIRLRLYGSALTFLSENNRVLRYFNIQKCDYYVQPNSWDCSLYLLVHLANVIRLTNKNDTMRSISKRLSEHTNWINNNERIVSLLRRFFTKCFRGSFIIKDGYLLEQTSTVIADIDTTTKASIDYEKILLMSHPTFSYFFHQTKTENGSNTLSILQPRCNHHCVNTHTDGFYKFFRNIRGNKFNDTSMYHFLVYQIIPLNTSQRRERTCTWNNSNRHLYNLTNNFQSVEIKHSNNNDCYFVADTIPDDIVTDYLKPFLKRVCRFHLNDVNDMKKLDQELMELSTLMRKGLVESQENHLEYEPIIEFLGRNSSYVSFFGSDYDTTESTSVQMYEIFKAFQHHVQQRFSFRFGTVEGIHRLFSLFYDTSIYFEMSNETTTDPSSSDSDVELFQKKSYSNILQYSYYSTFNTSQFVSKEGVGDEAIEEEWNNQLSHFREISKEYMIKKQDVCQRSGTDILDSILIEYCDLKNDIVKGNSEYENTTQYFQNRVLKFIIAFITHMRKEAGHSSTTNTYADPTLSNPIIDDCWQCVSRTKDYFWVKLKIPKSNDNLSKYTFKKMMFRNHTLRKTTRNPGFNATNQFFMISKGIRQENKTHYQVHALLLCIIVCNINHMCYMTLKQKLRDVREYQLQHNSLLNVMKRSNIQSNASFPRTLDYKFLSKFLPCCALN